jgi:hypothetical protein
MKYTLNGKTTDYLPDPCNGVSPMTDERFVEMGGTIEKGPQEFFLEGLDAYLDELEKEAREHYAISITKAEFKQAAATKMSGELVAWAKGKGVPDKMIEDVRADILVMIADASRIGLTWNDIFPKTN